jgi:hypothetical protein
MVLLNWSVWSFTCVFLSSAVTVVGRHVTNIAFLLRHELSSLTRALGSLFRFPLKAWIYVYVYSVFGLSCV